MNIIALIPARSQSKRIPNKNIYVINKHPLLAYTIQSAKDSGIFNGIYVSSDSRMIGWVATEYGAKFIECPLAIAHKDDDPDIKWVAHAIGYLRRVKFDAFSILRPTSPFRTGETIKRAWKEFNSVKCDSIRAVELSRQSPYKMWTIEGDLLKNLMNTNLYSMPTQILPLVFAQNASLEIAHKYCVTKMRSISGERIAPFYTEGYEGFDINEPRDLREAEYLIKSGEAKLPRVRG